MSTRAVIYARVSSDPKGLGRSVEDQERECRRVCASQGWDVAKVLVDNDRSASRYASKSRPAYKELIGLLNAGQADALVLWEASRAQRDLEAYVKLRDICHARGVLWSYSGRTYDLSRTDDRFQTGLDALLAERESDQTRDRVLRAVRSNAEKGRPHGRNLWGYRREYDPETKQLVRQVIVEDVAALVREASSRVATGEPCNAVARDFNARGLTTPTGRPWDLSQIRRVVTNPSYAGKRTHRGVIIGDASWPPIVDEAMWARVVERLSDPARRTTREFAIKHLLTGIATCGVCGAPIKRQKNRTNYAYLCGAHFCVARKQQWVDDYVTAVVLARLARPDVLELLHAGDGDDTASRARDEAAELRARLDGFYESATRGEITPAALGKIESRLLAQIDDADRRARTFKVPLVLHDVAGPGAESRWEALSLPQRREIVRALMTVQILPARRGAQTFDPDTVAIEWEQT